MEKTAEMKGDGDVPALSSVHLDEIVVEIAAFLNSDDSSFAADASDVRAITSPGSS